MDAESFVPRREIELAREKAAADVRLEIASAKTELRDEQRKDLAVIREDIGQIKLQHVNLRHDVRDLRQGQTDLSSKQDAFKCDLDALKDSVNKGFSDLGKKLGELSTSTETITQETAEGRTVIKHFRSWSSVATDIKRFWPHLLMGFFAYHAIGGWCAARGITWATLFAPHR